MLEELRKADELFTREEARRKAIESSRQIFKRKGDMDIFPESAVGRLQKVSYHPSGSHPGE